MKPTPLIYVELKSGYSDNGPAWIGKGYYSKSGKTIYFNGSAFGKTGISGNYFGEEREYWISGIKKKDTNRHWAGGGIIIIDEEVVNEFLKLKGWTALPKDRYKIENLNNEVDIEKFHREANKKIGEEK